MKKFFSIMMLCVVLLSLAGCVDKEAQEAVKTYVDTTSIPLKELEQKMLASYSSVIGMNYKDDSTLCLELVTNTIPMATSLQGAAETITETITEEELQEVHKLYVSYTVEFLGALRLMLTAVDEQNESIKDEANAKLETADVYAKEFRAGMQELKEKYKLVD